MRLPFRVSTSSSSLASAQREGCSPCTLHSSHQQKWAELYPPVLGKDFIRVGGSVCRPRANQLWPGVGSYNWPLAQSLWQPPLWLGMGSIIGREEAGTQYHTDALSILKVVRGWGRPPEAPRAERHLKQWVMTGGRQASEAAGRQEERPLRANVGRTCCTTCVDYLHSAWRAWFMCQRVLTLCCNHALLSRPDRIVSGMWPS